MAEGCFCGARPAWLDGECLFCEAEKPDEICVYCNTVHPMLDFGSDLNGNPTLICSDALNDAFKK